jgi:gamma-glutamylcyclotransferase (GGCT)/AIG2-like uncharacterized protein YtfP
MFPQVWRRVVRGRYRSMPATVRDYARYAIAGETYPGIISQPDEVVSGVVYFDVDERDVASLDAFEGMDYQRQTVCANTGSGEPMQVETYIYLNKARLTAEPWQPENFQLQHFIDTYCEAHAAR